MSSNQSSPINAGELIIRLQNKEPLNLLDVREKIEFYTHNIGGLNIPVKKLQENLSLLQWKQDDEIIVLCSKGLRSQTAKSILEENGYHNVRNLTGGLLAIEKLQSI